ncbi:MAG: putative bifunctional diguanylate cyclase/phosphodiesterase [Burkholderiaceae bacterium]
MPDRINAQPPAPTPSGPDPDRAPAAHRNRTALVKGRFVMAAISSVALCVLMGVLYLFGLMPAAVAATGTGLIMGSVLLFYLVFRFRLNEKVRDPSMTVPMTTVAVLCVLYVMLGSSAARDTFVSFFGLILLFAVFRFSTRMLLLQSGLMLLGYAAVIFVAWRTGAAGDAHGPDIARWLTLAIALPLFAVIGGEIMAGRRAAMQRLRASEERFRRLTALSSDWYWEQDEDLRFTALSPGLETKAGIAPWRLIGKTLPEIATAPLHGAWDVHWEATKGRLPFAQVEFQASDDSGALRWLSLSGEPLFDADHRFLGYYGTGRDITAKKAAEARIHFQAHHDALTGLANRMLLIDRLEHAMAQADSDGHALWVLFVDLDRFKRINDSLGHKAGDGVLKSVAQRMQAQLRPADTIARLGGDEFVLVLSDWPAGSLSLGLVQRMMDAVRAPYAANGNAILISCSVGIAVYPGDASTAELLVERADVAMYRAKEAGRNSAHFYKAEMNALAMNRLRMESDLRGALQANEFVLHYQPQMDLQSGRIVGVEALLRWQHMRPGLRQPAEFIGVAEEIGLIVPIGDWVLNQACLQAVAWQMAGMPPMHMAVNLSARQFAQPGLVSSVSAALERSGLQPSLLEIEITESLMMTDVEQAVATLADLKRLGVRVSVDDFGTGHSSLYYLKRFPIDVLKIDRSFVRDIVSDADDAAIVAAIVSLAHSLGMTVVAEGVEHADQLIYLSHCGCDTVQGYMISPPMRAEALDPFLCDAPAQVGVRGRQRA